MDRSWPRRIPSPAAIALAFVTVGCAGAEPKTDSECLGGKCDSIPAADRCMPLVVECPEDLEVLGKANDFDVHRVDFEWEHVPECESSVGPWIFAEIPSDAIGLSITVDAGSLPSGFAALSHSGDMLVDWEALGKTGWEDAPLYHSPTPAGTAVLPIDEQTRPRAGCLAIRPMVNAAVDGQPGNVQIVTRRGDEEDLANSELAVNVIVLEHAGIADEEILDAVDVMADIFSEAGAFEISSVALFETPHANGFVAASPDARAELRAIPIDDVDAQALNIFVVRDFEGEESLGEAAGIPGAIGTIETAGSGVIVSVDMHREVDGQILVNMLSETLAHEVGHQLGLFHTTEEQGGNDVFADTPDCTIDEHDGDGDGFLLADECPDGDHLMFWTSSNVSQRVVSATQTEILLRSPISRSR